MASWRDVIQQGMVRDIERRRMNPGVQNFGTLVRTAMELGIEKKKEERGEAAGARNIARSAIYQRYPGMAAEAAGMELPEGAGTPPGAPEDMEPYQVTYDETGRPTTVYRAPEKLDEPTLAKMYSQFITEIRATNAKYGLDKTYVPIPIPSFAAWKMEHFPEYAGGGAGGSLIKPPNVAQEDWDKATEEQKRWLLDQLGR